MKSLFLQVISPREWDHKTCKNADFANPKIIVK